MKKDLMCKPICQLSLCDLRALGDEIENPALFFAGRSSVLTRSNIPVNGFDFKDIPTRGKVLEVLEPTKSETSETSSFHCGAIKIAMSRHVLWLVIKERLDRGQIVDIDAPNGIVTAHERV